MGTLTGDSMYALTHPVTVHHPARRPRRDGLGRKAERSTQPASEGTGRPLAEDQVDNSAIDGHRNDETAAQ
jgi:hypothetical protein